MMFGSLGVMLVWSTLMGGDGRFWGVFGDGGLV
jgi:hypothetical protein